MPKSNEPAKPKHDSAGKTTKPAEGCPSSPDEAHDRSLGKNSASSPSLGKIPYTPRDVGTRLSPQLMRLAGSGMEMASYTLLMGAAGYWLDGRIGNAKPWLGVAGALFGFTLGMYRLIALAIRNGNSKY